MRTRILSAAIVSITALFIGSSALAQLESTPIPNTPKPNFSSMQFLVGTWNCTESNTRRATPYTSTFTTSMDPSGYWIITKTTAHATSFAPLAVAEDRVTYDAANRRWIDINTDDQGQYGATYSSGWHGNTIAWQSTPFFSVNSGNIVSTGVYTTTKQSNRNYTYVGSFKEDSGRTINVKGACTKVS